MFDKSGGAASGNKQDAMNSAAQTVMKLMVKNQVSGVSPSPLWCSQLTNR